MAWLGKMEKWSIIVVPFVNFRDLLLLRNEGALSHNRVTVTMPRLLDNSNDD